MPTRFAALAQWYELTWGNVVGTRPTARPLPGGGARGRRGDAFSRFSILVAAKA